MNVLKTYAMYSKNEAKKKNSSSGGIFYEIAHNIIKNYGVVYGVTMCDANKAAKYKRVCSEEEIDCLLGSKYLQASVGNSFKDVKNDLDSGKYVLFSGTGCCINGLKSFLGRDYNNLLCIEVICHGVPSSKLWKKYLEYIENKYRMRVKTVNFRCKDKSWNGFGISETDGHGKKYFCTAKNDIYMSMFLRDYSLRPSCYNCLAKRNHDCDITLGDCWGIDNFIPEMNNERGTSLVIVRTKKGVEFIDRIQDDIVSSEVDYDIAIKYNPAEFKSVIKPSERDSFFADMNSMSFAKLADKYLYNGIKGKIKKFILSSPLKRILR